jgi:hypothetical protein
LSIEIVGLRKDQVRAMWGVIEPVVTPAIMLNSGRMTVADVGDLAASGRGKLWLAKEDGEILGVVLGFPVQYPRRKALCIPFIAGSCRERWQDQMMETIERGARHIGCDLIEGTGRRGFTRVLPGYSVSGVSYEKDLRPV